MKRTYDVWRNMLSRIRNPNAKGYKYYGGRGLDIDPRWDDFKLFLADMGEQPAGLTLERVDNNRGYWPDNCVWATHAVQNRNKRQRKDVTLTYVTAEEIRWRYSRGETYEELAERFNVHQTTVRGVVARRTYSYREFYYRSEPAKRRTRKQNTPQATTLAEALLLLDDLNR